MKINKIILASASPRRSELMKSAGFRFEVIPSTREEVMPEGLPPEQTVMELAKMKAADVFEKQPNNNNCSVVGADTIVVLDEEYLTKPIDEDDAFAMLRKLSGRCHSVFTGVSVMCDNFSKTFFEETNVEFYELSDDEINAYIKTGEPFDKAGGYGIQGSGMLLVKSIQGDFYNVMGLPVSKLDRELRELQLDREIKKTCDINELITIMKRLRKECPWDREQTHKSIRANVIEEAYEVAEAIDSVEPKQLREELGDLLLQVVFHSEMASEKDNFDFDDVCTSICDKLIYRHPHVFGDIKADSTDKVLSNWDNLKSNSKGEKTVHERLLNVPKTLPALMRGEKVGKRASNAGFDLDDLEEAIACLKSEIAELEEAVKKEDEHNIEEELGDILFSCCNISRFLKKDCEKALTFSINKFIIRFKGFEDELLKTGRVMSDFDRPQLDEMWENAKLKAKITDESKG